MIEYGCCAFINACGRRRWTSTNLLYRICFFIYDHWIHLGEVALTYLSLKGWWIVTDGCTLWANRGRKLFLLWWIFNSIIWLLFLDPVLDSLLSKNEALCFFYNVIFKLRIATLINIVLFVHRNIIITVMILFNFIKLVYTRIIIDYFIVDTFVTTRGRMIILLKEWHLDY